MPRIGPQHVLIVSGIALLLVGVGGAVATVPSADQSAGEDTAGSQDPALAQGGDVNITAPTPGDGAYEVDETVPIELSLDGTDVATVTVGADEDPQNARFTATVRDTDGSGDVTVSFDTGSFTGEADGFSAGDGAEIVNTSSVYSDEVAESGLDPITYDLSVAAGDQPHYEEAVGPADSSIVALIDPQVTVSSPTSGTAYEGDEAVPLDLTLADTDTGTLSITFVGGDSVTFTATARDGNGDGNATVTFDPEAFDGGDDVFSAGNGTTLVDTAGAGDAAPEDLSVPSLYDVTVAPGQETPENAGVSPTDSVELVVTGGDEDGGEGAEDGEGEDSESSTEDGEDGESSTEDGEDGESSTEDGSDDESSTGEDGSSMDGTESADDDDSADDDSPGFGVLAVLGALAVIALVVWVRSG